MVQHANTETLDPIAPLAAIELYLDLRSSEVSETTLRSHRYRLSHFSEWCEDCGITNMNDLSGRLLHEFRLWRREEGELNNVSLQTQLCTLRVFIRFCETVDAVGDNLHDKIILPTVEGREGARDAILGGNRAENILSYLRKYEYASVDHALFELIWHSGMRVGEAHSLDVGNFHPKKQRLAVEHRPRGGTSLKNGKGGERFVALSDTVCEVLFDHIENQRCQVTDGHEREPLFASKYGRYSKSSLRRIVYRVTQPCLVGECPHDRNPEECEAEGYTSTKCPSGVGPHDTIRGVITHFLAEDIPEKVVSDRMDVSQKVLDKHYDRRTEEQKVEQRRQFIEDL